MNIFFSADSHFFHANILKFCKRPFQSVEEMNEELVKRWNAKVGKGDWVYHVGDFAYRAEVQQVRSIRARLNGEIILVEGNHDGVSLQCQAESPSTFKHVCQYMEVQDGKKVIVLFHYGLRTWHHDLRGAVHLYGHSHGGLPPYGKSFDVGVDCWNFEPLSLEEVWKEMEKRPIGDHPKFAEFMVEAGK